MDNVLEEGLKAGAAAGMAAIGGTMLCGAMERGAPWEPVNAVSHMVYGDRVRIARHFVPFQSLLGLTGHFGACLGWGVLYRLLLRRGGWPGSLLTASAFTAAVWTVDYRIVPKRLTPGFEKVLSRPAIAVIYALLAVGLATGSKAPDERS